VLVRLLAQYSDHWPVSGLYRRRVSPENPFVGKTISSVEVHVAVEVPGRVAARGPSPQAEPGTPQKRHYLLAGLLICGACGGRMESAWSNGKRPTGAVTGTPAQAPPNQAGQECVRARGPHPGAPARVAAAADRA
jgi:hypothetical protein